MRYALCVFIFAAALDNCFYALRFAFLILLPHRSTS